MAQIKQRRRPDIDYPSGRGAGGPTAAGVHSVDRKLGATPTNFRLQGASGQPSSSADSGYSRSTVQRVNRGYEALKDEEDIPEISWLKQNADHMAAMGLTPRVVVEMYCALQQHTPRNSQEREAIASLNRKILISRRNVRPVTRLALLETRQRLNEGVPEVISSLFGGEGAEGDKNTEERDRNQEQEEKDVLSSSRDLSGDPITHRELEDASDEENLTSGVLACNSHSLEVFQTFLAVTGVVGDLGDFFGVPVGVAADLTNALINIVCGNYFYAFLDLIAVVPFAGDLAKIFYAKRLIKSLGLVGDMAVIKKAGTIAEQAEDASRIIESALASAEMGPKVSKRLLSLQKVFKSADAMAERISNLLKRVVDRAIKYLTEVKDSAAAGSISSKAVQWVLTKMPIDVLKILQKIKMNGVPGLKEFIQELFSRKGAQKTASVAQVRHEIIDAAEEGEETEGQTSLPREESPYGNLIRGPMHVYSPFEDTNQNGVPDDEEEGLPSVSTNRLAMVAEAKRKRKDAVKKPPRKMSLKRALAGDDSDVDESTVASALGTPGQPGAGGYIIPLGMTPKGAKRKSAEQLTKGYEFVGGHYPYSR